MILIFIIFISLLVGAHIIEYQLEKRLWNDGVCGKCNTKWKQVGHAAYTCSCKTKHFTHNWS